MHPALLIHEILQRIFIYVRGDRSPRCLATLAGLSRTCKTFSDPALDVLWSELDSLHPLFRLLPLELYETADLESKNVLRCWAFCRHVVDEDWTAFSAYAARVRSVRHHASDPDIAASSLQSIAITRPTVNLVPHLQALDWRGLYDIGILNAVMFISPSLTRFKIDARERPAALHTLFQIVASRAPRLKKATIHYSSPDTGAVLVTKGLVKQLRHLTNVDVSAVNATPHILADLAAMPHLRQMSMTTLNLFPAMDFVFPGNTFPVLDEVDLALPMELCVEVLQSSTTKSLHSVKLYPNGENVIMGEGETRQLLSSVCTEDRINTLKTLVVEPYHKLDSEDRRTIQLSADSFNIDINTLSPILPMRTLANVHITTGYTFNLTDADISTIAQALPQLKRLHLGSPHAACAQARPAHPLPTLRALVHIARHCRGLRDLALCMDAAAPNGPSLTVDGKELSLPFLEKLHVGPSPITRDAASNAADFLAGFCPALAHVTWMGGRGDWVAGRARASATQIWDDQVAYRAWGMVVNYMPFIQHGRIIGKRRSFS